MSSFDLQAYVSLFLEELDEQIMVMDDEIMRLEQTGYTGDGIQTLFRAAHTIKGSSAALGVEPLKELTHEMESLLDKLRSRELGVTPRLVGVLFLALDAIKSMKQAIERGEVCPLPDRSLLRDIQNLRDGFGFQPDWQIAVTVHSACEMKWARASVIHSKLSEWGEILNMTPPLTDSDSYQGDQDERFASLAFRFRCPRDAGEIRQILANMLDIESVDILPVQPEESAIAVPAGPDAEEQPELALEKPKLQTIRVQVERLEALMNLVGELVIDQTRIDQVKRNLGRKFKADDDVEELMLISDHVSRTVGELQEQIMKARMLPIEQLFNRFPRMVRDLSRNLHKQVNLQLEGKETELDRTLIEEIGDPLIHLIRNAVDHGIETPEIRKRQGKPEEGLLKIRAYHQDNQVVITIEDDGAGIHPERIKASAVAKGLLTEETARELSDREAIHLIFQAGFSTAETVSDVSGRGVGMDIVRSDIERLNGLIDIETEIGQGTRFTIRLPLTLAIISGLLVKISERSFILPMSNVAEIIRIPQEAIQTIRGEPAIVVRNHMIPLIYPHEYFRYDRPVDLGRQLPIVVVGSAEKRVALYVDELIGNQEIVIKSLGAYIGNVEYISGSTILGDGKVSLIVDVADFLKVAGSGR